MFFKLVDLNGKDINTWLLGDLPIKVHANPLSILLMQAHR
jgi:hypothetical protein